MYHVSYMYNDFALNDLKWSVCYRTKANSPG